MSPATTMLAAARGEMAGLIRQRDWSGSSMGEAEAWPQSLRMALAICLHSRFPMFVWWGGEMTNLYNDAYIPILGDRHPDALGRSAPDVWADIWEVIGDQARAVMDRRESTWNDRVRLLLRDEAGTREGYFTWSFIPVPDDGGGAGGLLCTVVEETDRVRSEKVLAETRRRLNSALIAGEVGTFEWDVAADRLWGDANFQRIFGVEVDPSGAAPLAAYTERIHPDDRDRVAERVGHTVETGSDYEVEYRVVRGGETRWVVARGKAGRDGAGRVARFAGVVLDITGRREAEEALRASEAKYRAVFESIDEGFSIIQVLFDGDEAVDYRFLEGNPAWERHTGLVGVLGRTAREVIPDLEEHWFQIYGKVARTGEAIRFESGSEAMGRWFDVYAFPFDEPGSGKVALLFKDISERKRTREALAQSRERFRAVLENALDAGYRRDLRSDTYDYLSPRVQEVLGIGVEALRSLSVEDVLDRIHPEDRDHVAAAIEEGLAQGRGRVEYRFLGDHGEYRWLADHFTVQTDDAGTPIFRTGIVRDVSDRKTAEAELEAAKEAAEEASQAKSQFLAVMSHELRTPLSGVIGFADLMETEVMGPTTAKQQESLASIKASAWHLIGIIEEILTLSRAEAGSEVVRWRDADLAEIAREVLRSGEAQARGQGLEVQAAELDEPAPLRTDPGKVRQVLTNLVGNAVKYTAEGTITVRLDRDDGGSYRVHVEDTGPGIPDAELERIFEPFTQVDNSLTREASGTGLGLAICRRLARLLGGDVTVASESGQGSTFTLTLPRAPEE